MQDWIIWTRGSDPRLCKKIIIWPKFWPLIGSICCSCNYGLWNFGHPYILKQREHLCHFSHFSKKKIDINGCHIVFTCSICFFSSSLSVSSCSSLVWSSLRLRQRAAAILFLSRRIFLRSSSSGVRSCGVLAGRLPPMLRRFGAGRPGLLLLSPLAESGPGDTCSVVGPDSQ